MFFSVKNYVKDGVYILCRTKILDGTYTPYKIYHLTDYKKQITRCLNDFYPVDKNAHTPSHLLEKHRAAFKNSLHETCMREMPGIVQNGEEFDSFELHIIMGASENFVTEFNEKQSYGICYVSDLNSGFSTY